MLRRTVFQLHLYCAFAAGIFICILGLTGSVMAFEPELSRLLHRRVAYVAPQARALSLAEIGAAVSNAFPGERIVEYDIATSPDQSYQVALRGRQLVYVNPYTGAVLGTSSGSDWVDNLQNRIHQFHLRLVLRPAAGVDRGREIMSWAGLAILFLLLSGLYLWWPLKRVSIRPGASSGRFSFDLHNAAGIFSLVFLLLLAGTGVIIGFSEKTVPWFYKVTGSTPPRPPRIIKVTPRETPPISPDQVLQIARAALPGAAPFRLSLPGGPGAAYQVACRYPEDRTPGGRSTLIVDPYTGNILYALSSRTAPGGMRMENANRAIHTGDLFGIPGKVVMSAASLMAPLQLGTGLMMWWTRRKRRRRAVGPDAV